MAGYREHIGFSGILGVGYGAAATWLFGFSPVQGTLAFLLTWFAGMLPDIDSQTGRPVQEIFGVVAVLAPLITMQHLSSWGGDKERILLICIIFYVVLRNFGATLLGRLSVHRGMFHSIPALLVASLITFLFYKHDDLWVRVMMAGAVGVGFLSHLILDEIYSVQWTGTRIKLAKSAGSALKWFGSSVPANAVSWALVMFLSYATLVDLELIDPNATRITEEIPADSAPVEETMTDAPLFGSETRTVEDPKDPRIGETDDRRMIR